MSPSSLSRRAMLRSSAVGMGALVLAACGNSSGNDQPVTPGPTEPSESDAPISMEEEIVAAIGAAGFEGIPDWTVIIATFEVLTGPSRIQIGLLDETQAPAPDRQVELALVRSGDLEVVQRIDDTTFHGEGLGIRGVYVFESDVPTEGLYYLVAMVDGHVGAAPLQAIAPEKSQVPRVGQAFPSAATATVADPGDLAQLCTLDPDCSMHDHSLDTALAEGKPVVLVVATPLYCQTAVCGPVVEVVEAAKLDGLRDDVVWIHTEVFKDAGNTPTEFVSQTLRLPSEPWTFLVASDGTLADRFDGPVVPSLLRDAVLELQ